MRAQSGRFRTGAQALLVGSKYIGQVASGNDDDGEHK